MKNEPYFDRIFMLKLVIFSSLRDPIILSNSLRSLRKGKAYIYSAPIAIVLNIIMSS